MKKNNLCSEIGYMSINHYGEQLCGDHVEIVENDDSSIIVLADGLASGDMANDVGTVLYGEQAVAEGIIDRVGTLSDALEALYGQIARRRG